MYAGTDKSCPSDSFIPFILEPPVSNDVAYKHNVHMYILYKVPMCIFAAYMLIPGWRVLFDSCG